MMVKQKMGLPHKELHKVSIRIMDSGSIPLIEEGATGREGGDI